MIEVWAGPDDYSFERDRYLWRMWIKQNITTTGFRVEADADDAYKGNVIFDDERLDIIFRLKAPEYIDAALVDCSEPWILGESSP